MCAIPSFPRVTPPRLSRRRPSRWWRWSGRRSSSWRSTAPTTTAPGGGSALGGGSSPQGGGRVCPCPLVCPCPVGWCVRRHYLWVPPPLCAPVPRRLSVFQASTGWMLVLSVCSVFPRRTSVLVVLRVREKRPPAPGTSPPRSTSTPRCARDPSPPPSTVGSRALSHRNPAALVTGCGPKAGSPHAKPLGLP